jgi:hypothetical protein
MNVDQNQTPVTYFKAPHNQEEKGAVGQSRQGLATSTERVTLATSNTRSKKKNFKTLGIVLGLLIFAIGLVSVLLISQKQDTTPVAPNAPTSQPAAYVEKVKTCTLEFEVTAVATATPTPTPTPTRTPTPPLTGTPTPPLTATPTPNLLVCGAAGCSTTDDCQANLVCISTAAIDAAGKIIKYCSDQAYLDECVANPNQTNCCSATLTITPTPTSVSIPTPTITPYPSVTPIVIVATPTPTTAYVYNYPTTNSGSGTSTVVTTVNCNDSCNENADCRNISHICYEGVCRLDVNPTDEQCRLANGETSLVRPVSVPTQTGPADWMNYIKAGLGTLGIGALLLLLL